VLLPDEPSNDLDVETLRAKWMFCEGNFHQHQEDEKGARPPADAKTATRIMPPVLASSDAERHAHRPVAFGQPPQLGHGVALSALAWGGVTIGWCPLWPDRASSTLLTLFRRRSTIARAQW
jgi:hypothetical protein